MSSAPDDPKTQQSTTPHTGPHAQPATPQLADLQLARSAENGAVVRPHPSGAASTAPAPALEKTPPIRPEQRRSILSTLNPLSRGAAATPATPGEKYEIVGELGKGGGSQVLRVRDHDLKRDVAMKILHPETGTQPAEDALIRFVEEARATGQLEHPNIVPVHDIGVDDAGHLYFTFKYVDGVSLHEAIHERNEDAGESGAYSALQMVQILISICQAVAYAHSKGIIHRDLKPAGVMLGKYGEVLVMDWGLAKIIGRKPARSEANDGAGIQSQSTLEANVAGAPAYMSPEQASGKVGELDRRADIYALGAMLYEIVTGAPPYRGTIPGEVLKQVVKGPPVPLKSQKGAPGFSPIPREVAAICERAMARKASNRYPSALDMRDDLQAYIENLPVSAAPDTRIQLLQKWSKRNRRQIQSRVGSVAAVLLILVVAWFAWRTYRVYNLVADGESHFTAARTEYRNKAAAAAASSDEPYGGQASRAQSRQRANVFRDGLHNAMEPLRRALDLSPRNNSAQVLMADIQMELWRLAVAEENDELARVTRREVERIAPDPKAYEAELNGYGFADLTFDSLEATVFLFRFEPLSAASKADAATTTRLIPVPYDLKERRLDAAFLSAEETRIRNDEPLDTDLPSIFNLEPTPASRVGKGDRVQLPSLPPGSYMLLVRAPGRMDVRIALRMDRLAQVKQDYVLPESKEVPKGFFYMAGGNVIVGGDTAGAPARHTVSVSPAWISSDETSMEEYESFLQWLVQNGRGAEAQRRLPKDFGRNLATLGANGRMVPAELADRGAFLKSPVRGVSYNDAQAYIAWRSRQDGLPYRLPNDWEWEAACRGADGRLYSWGDIPSKGLAALTQGYGDAAANMSWAWEDYKDESPWGIHNLAGGAAEWTGSLYNPAAKPEDPISGQYTIRGNAWALPPVGLECAFRTFERAEYFHPTIGFRLALDHPYVRSGQVGQP